MEYDLGMQFVVAQPRMEYDLCRRFVVTTLGPEWNMTLANFVVTPSEMEYDLGETLSSLGRKGI